MPDDQGGKSDDASGAVANSDGRPHSWDAPGGGQSGKVHLATDHRCRPLAFVLTAGQAADGPQFIPVLDKVRVRGPVGRPRTRPDAVAGDKAYSSCGNRTHLRRRGIKAVIPEKRDQAANRKRKGRKVPR
jgi:transposase